MGCNPMKGEDGRIVGFLCGPRGQRKRFNCQTCLRRPSSYQCDYVLAPGAACDRHLCGACAVVVGQDVHHCPSHPPADPAPMAAPVSEAKQGDLPL